MDENTKPWWKSTGVWGSVVAIGASGAGLLGYSVTPDDQAAIVSTVQHAIQLGTQIMAFAGGVVALWGRLRATKAIG